MPTSKTIRFGLYEANLENKKRLQDWKPKTAAADRCY